ncbi:MAG: hypothetical protein Ct9H90mP13_12440 [Pseudomonadota bacterium]|nr:MAG: hypothetical protein Ct9H90mP13_12440 [Pseudomonadota bacterium]
MQMNLIKKHGAIYLFLLFLIHIPIKGFKSSPWATPDDVLVKHDLQILSDAGVLNIPNLILGQLPGVMWFIIKK